MSQARSDLITAVVQALQNSNSTGVFQYKDASETWVPSTIYTWEAMTQAINDTATIGIGSESFWVGEASNHIYGLVNVATFLAQTMSEAVAYNACDENNWSGKSVVEDVGGKKYSAASA